MKKIVALLICIISFCGETFAAETYISNVYGRQYESLNGKWNAIVDLYERGEEMKLYLNQINNNFTRYSIIGTWDECNFKRCFVCA